MAKNGPLRAPPKFEGSDNFGRGVYVCTHCVGKVTLTKTCTCTSPSITLRALHPNALACVGSGGLLWCDLNLALGQEKSTYSATSSYVIAQVLNHKVARLRCRDYFRMNFRARNPLPMRWTPMQRLSVGVLGVCSTTHPTHSTPACEPRHHVHRRDIRSSGG